ncbi:MAG: UvrD-helicase domain-containing protein [Deltaproteobacteria bacterium]|nr:UvrD-helicase domain-containing protein [Deltaproteobacteria bacterium]
MEHERGPLLVLAGAGSGKTRVITQRIARLVERGVAPEAILAVSFTNKAAGEMGERMVPLVGAEAAGRLVLSTFHSFGVRLLTEEKEAVGLGRFVVFDQGDSLGVVREVMHRLRRSAASRRLDPAAVHARISLWKNRFLGPEEVPETDLEYDSVARDVFPRYEAALRAMCAVDFDDLVDLPVELLKREPAIREKWRTRFRHVLVDEFQDTNRAQLELVRLLANDDRNVCVVGDDDQAIYGWRGADVSNILDFTRHFPGAQVVKLEDNYRSRAPILAVANAAIAAGGSRRHGKELRSARGPGDRVSIVTVETPDDEARFVAREIGALHGAGARYADVAVLYRGSLQARPVEEELRAAGIPYQLFGGTRLFDRKEVKDATAYLRVVANPKDEISLRRILNYPARGIGEATVERVERKARSARVPFVEALRRIDGDAEVPDGARRGVQRFFEVVERARGRFRGGAALAVAARSLLQEVGLRAALEDVADGGASGVRRWENVESLLRSIERYERTGRSEKPSIGAFLAGLALRAAEDDDAQEGVGNQVTLSTLHAAKGLEFGVVFLIGCVEGQLPHVRTTDPKVTDAGPTDVEEERRLFYVGVTRARDRLLLTRARRRALRGKEAAIAPSRFLEGLPESQIEVIEDKASSPLCTGELAERTRAFLERLGGGGNREKS